MLESIRELKNTLNYRMNLENDKLKVQSFLEEYDD